MCKISYVCAGDPSEIGMGDDLSLLAKWQPGGLWWYGQHAHHVQHQQQVGNGGGLKNHIQHKQDRRKYK